MLAAVDAGLIPLQRAIEALTVGPARVLGAAAVGRPVGLVEGAPADLVVFDRSEGWTVAPDGLRVARQELAADRARAARSRAADVAGGRLAFDDATG